MMMACIITIIVASCLPPPFVHWASGCSLSWPRTDTIATLQAAAHRGLLTRWDHHHRCYHIWSEVPCTSLCYVCHTSPSFNPSNVFSTLLFIHSKMVHALWASKFLGLRPPRNLAALWSSQCEQTLYYALSQPLKITSPSIHLFPLHQLSLHTQHHLESQKTSSHKPVTDLHSALLKRMSLYIFAHISSYPWENINWVTQSDTWLGSQLASPTCQLELTLWLVQLVGFSTCSSQSSSPNAQVFLRLLARSFLKSWIPLLLSKTQIWGAWASPRHKQEIHMCKSLVFITFSVSKMW